MAPEDEGNRIEAVVTCEGNLHDPDFSIRFQELVDKLKSLLHLDDEKEEEESPLEVKKIEPWNSVRVTISIPKEAAERLRFLAQSGSELLRQLGILSVQVEGDQVISLTFVNHGEVVLRQPEDSTNNSSSHSASIPTSHHNDLSSCPTSSTFLSDLDILGLPLEHLTQSSPVNVNVSSGPNGGLSMDLASGGGGSAFRSPNTVAPSGESIPFFPPKTVVLGPPRPPPGGPYPFASMTHAAHAHAMQRTDSTTPTTPTPPGTPNNINNGSGSGGSSSATTSKSTNILTSGAGGNDPGPRFVYSRSNSAISQANSSQSLQIQVVNAGAGQPAASTAAAPPPYPQQQQQQQLQHMNALRFQQHQQQQLAAQHQQQQQQQVASPGSSTPDKPMASSPLLVNLLQHGDNFSNSSSSPTTPTQSNYANVSSAQQQQMPPPPLTMTLSVDNNNAKRYQLFSSHPQQHQLQQQQQQLQLQQQLQQLQQKKGVRRGLSLDTSINAPTQQQTNPGGGIHGSLSQPGSPAMNPSTSTPATATDGGFQFALPLPLSSTNGAQGQGQTQDGSAQRPQGIYHQQGSFRVLNPAQLLAFHQQQQQQGQGQVRGTLRLPQQQGPQPQIQGQGQGPIRIAQQQGGFQLQGRSYAGQGGQVQYSVQQGQSQVQNVQGQMQGIQIQGQGQGQGVFQTQQGAQMQIQQNRLQGNIQIQNRGPIQGQNPNAFQQQQQQMQGQMRAHIRNLGPLQFQNQNQNQSMVQIQRPGQQQPQQQQNQMMNQNQTHPQGSLHLQIQNQLQASLEQMQQNQNQQHPNSQMQMQQQQHLQNYNNQSPMGSPQYHNLAPPQSPLSQGSPETQQQGQGHLRIQMPMQSPQQQQQDSQQQQMPSHSIHGQGQGSLQQIHGPGSLRIQTMAQGQQVQMQQQQQNLHVQGQSPHSPSPMQMQMSLHPPQSPSPSPVQGQQQPLMNGPHPQQQQQQQPSTPTTTTGHLFLAPTSAPPKPMSTKPRPGVSPTTYVAPSKPPRMAMSQAMGMGGVSPRASEAQTTFLIQNEAKSTTPSHLKPSLMGAAAGQPMKKDGPGQPQPSGKPRLLLINPLTGHLEPMPPSESSSDSEEGDEDEGEAKGKGKPEVSSLRRPSLPIHLEGMPPLQLANQNPPLLGPVSATARKSQDGGPPSPSGGNEKIKLRLKLEKSEPAYKVDISFLKKPERGTISSSPAPSSSMSPGAFFSRMRMSRPMPPPPVQPQTTGTGKPHAHMQQQQQQTTGNPHSPAAAATTSDPPRVPPLHISLRGRNAAVVVSPRREENTKDNISLNLNSGNSSPSQAAASSPETQIVKINSDNQSLSGSAKGAGRTKSRLKSTGTDGKVPKGSQGQSRPRENIDDKDKLLESYTPGKIRNKSHSLSSENLPLISGSPAASSHCTTESGVPKVKSRRKSELIPSVVSSGSQLFKHLVQSLPIVSQQAATTAAAAVTLTTTSPSPVFTPLCDNPNNTGNGNENLATMAMDWQGNSEQQKGSLPSATKSSNIPNLETSSVEISTPKPSVTQYPTPPSSVETNPYEFMQHDYAIHGPSPCMGMGFRSKPTTTETAEEKSHTIPVATVPVISKDLKTMNVGEMTQLPHNVNDAKEKENVGNLSKAQNHVIGGAEIEIRQMDKIDGNGRASSSTKHLSLPLVLPITIPSKGPDEPGHGIGTGNGGNGNGVAGEDSGIDSMDALSEKSPNQGETPPRRESDRDQNHPFVCDKLPQRSRSTEGGELSEGKVPLINTRLTEEKMDLNLTENLLDGRVNTSGPLHLPNISESENENELNIDLPDLIVPIDHSENQDAEELLSNVEAYLGGFDDFLPDECDTDGIQVQEFSENTKTDKSESESLKNKEDTTTTTMTSDLKSHENENEELKDIQLQGFSPLGAGDRDADSELSVEQKGTDDIFDVKLQVLQDHDKPMAEDTKDREVNVEEIQNEIAKQEPEIEHVVVPVIESQEPIVKAVDVEAFAEADTKAEPEIVEPVLSVPAQNVETTINTQPISAPTETAPEIIPAPVTNEPEIETKPDMEVQHKMEESVAPVPPVEPELIHPEVPEPMETEVASLPVVETTSHALPVPISEIEQLETTKAEAMELEPDPTPEIENVQHVESEVIPNPIETQVTLPEPSCVPQETKTYEPEKIVRVPTPPLSVSIESEKLEVPTIPTSILESVELKQIPTSPVIPAPEITVTNVDMPQPEAAIPSSPIETTEPISSEIVATPVGILKQEILEPTPTLAQVKENLVEDVKEFNKVEERTEKATGEIESCVVDEPEILEKVEEPLKSEPEIEIAVKSENTEVIAVSTPTPVPVAVPKPMAPVEVEVIPVAKVQTEVVPQKQIPLAPQVKLKPKVVAPPVAAAANTKIIKEVEIRPKPEIKPQPVPDPEVKVEVKPVTIPNVIHVLPTTTARIEPTISTPVAIASPSAPPKLDSEITAALAKLRPQLTPHFSASLERLPGLPNLVRPKVYPNTQVHVHEIMSLPRLQPKPLGDEQQKQESPDLTATSQQQAPPKFPKQQNSINLPRATVLPNVIQLATTSSPIPVSMSQVKVTQAQAASINMSATGTTTIYAIHPHLGAHHPGITLASGHKVVPIKLVTLPKHTTGPGGAIVNRGSPSNFLEAIAASAAARSGSPMGNPVQSSPLNLSSMGGNVHFVPLSHHSAQSPMKLVVSSPIKVGSPIPHPQQQMPNMLQTVMVKMAANQQQQPHAVQTPTDPPISTEAEVAHMPARTPEDRAEPITKIVPATPTPILVAKIEKQPEPVVAEPEDYSYKNVDGVELLDTTSLEATEDGFPYEADIIHDEKDLADVLASEKVIHNGIGGTDDPYDLSHALAMESNHVDLKFRPVNDDSKTAEVQQSEEEEEDESESEIRNSIPSSPVRIVRSSSPLYTYSNRGGNAGKNSHAHAKQQRSSGSSSSRSRSPTPPPDILHGEDQEIIDSFSDKDDHNYGDKQQPAAGRNLEALSIEIPVDEKPTRSTRSNTRLVSPDITAFRSDTPKPVKLLKPDSVKNSPKPSPTGSLNKAHLFLHSPSLRSSPTPALLLNSEGHNSTNPKNIKVGVNANCTVTTGGSNKRKRRESDSSSASKDETEDGKTSESSSDVNSRPGKRRCSENAAELIKACIGVEDTPKRNNSVHHKESSAKPKSGKGRKNMHVVPEESDDEFESVEMFVRGMGGCSSRGSSEDRSSSRGSSVHRNSLPPKTKDEETGKEIRTNSRAPNRAKIPKDDTKSKQDGGSHQNSNANAAKKRTGTPNAKRGNKTTLKGKSPLTLAKTKTNIRKDLMGVSGSGSDKSSTSATTSPENENSRRKTRSSVAVGSTDSDSPSQKRRRVSKDTKS